MLGFVGQCGGVVAGRSGPARRRVCTRVAQPEAACTSAGSVECARKQELIQAIDELVVDRGIFGVQRAEREKLDLLMSELENVAPHRDPASRIEELVSGNWRVVYTSLTILGSKRVQLAVGSSTKSGLVKIEDLFQSIDAETSTATNRVDFSVMGKKTGSFTVWASYEPISDIRVTVNMEGSKLQPESFEKMLGKNLKLLTDIFNPSGFLDITYVDETLRIGRDHNDNVFVLERVV